MLLAAVDRERGGPSHQREPADEGRQPVGMVHVEMGDHDPGHALGIHGGQQELLDGAAPAIHQDRLGAPHEDQRRIVPAQGRHRARGAEKGEVHARAGQARLRLSMIGMAITAAAMPSRLTT